MKSEDAARGDIDRQRDPGTTDALPTVIIDDMDVDQRMVDLDDRQRRRLAQRSRLESDALLGFLAPELVLGDDPGIERLQAPDDRIAARPAQARGVTASPRLLADRLVGSARLGQEDRIDRGIDLALGLG